MKAKQPKPLKALQPYKEVLEKEVWGPVFWKVLHHRAKQGLTERWLDGFQAAIMCPDCLLHFCQLRERFPRKAFADDEHAVWFWHNAVNTERANKPFYYYEEWLRHKDD